MRKRISRIIALVLALGCTIQPGLGLCLAKAESAQAGAQVESGENWFGEDFAYDITDTETCWKLLQQPITVLNVGEKEIVYVLKEPGGERVFTDEQGGTISGTSAGVHVLGKDEKGWTLIEGMDEYDRLVRGYVQTKLLKTITPNSKYGVIIDKLTQRLYVFIDGQFFSSCAVSTGMVYEEKPYTETASGEYLICSWVGAFENEFLICEKALRFNNGDLIHQVPYIVLGDGTQRYEPYESKLGQKASHGCVRTARYPNDEGLCIQWLWDNLKKNTKVLIWDDDGRALPYPAEDTPLYYNKSGGTKYHSSATCRGVRARYHPLASFLYRELEDSPYNKLEPCSFCTPSKRKAWVDEFNHGRGMETPVTVETPATEATSEETEAVPTFSGTELLDGEGGNEALNGQEPSATATPAPAVVVEDTDTDEVEFIFPVE